ncbi:MAG: exosortase K [Saprospiraceae bacterium]|nr:exosortase K [Saprospiraceae bacterium]
MKTNSILPEAWLYPSLAILLFFLMKTAYSTAAVQDLTFLLFPSSELVGTFTGTSHVFLVDQGYYNEALNILVNKSCSGFNFWAISFLMSYCLIEKSAHTWQRNILLLPTILIATYFFTILVNGTRILFSVFLHSSPISMLTEAPPWMHQAEGSFIYLSYLIIAFLSIDYFQTPKTATR